MPFQVYTKDWHENAFGEQGEGPWVARELVETEDEAKKVAVRHRVIREETESGGAYGTWARYEKAQ